MRKVACIAVVATLVAGCSMFSPRDDGTGGGRGAMGERSLYERLGGKRAITRVVDDFVGNVGADKRIAHFFKDTDLPRLKGLLVDQICQASGGPCTYTGRSMKETHRGMGVSQKDFDALVADLVAALDKNKVGEREKKELLAILGPMQKEIVESRRRAAKKAAPKN
jgi:hemoglobin